MFSRPQSHIRVLGHFLLVSFFLIGCTRYCKQGHRDMSPEQVVQAYLDTALNMTAVSQKSDLMRFTTGNLKAAIANASDDVVKKAYIDRRYKIIDYAVVERWDRTPRETEITFRLTYNDLGNVGSLAKEDASPKVTTENTVSVIRENQLWLIRDVLGNRSTIDFPVSAAAIIKPCKPGDTSPECVQKEEEVPPPQTDE